MEMRDYTGESWKELKGFYRVAPGMTIKLHEGNIVTYYYKVNSQTTCEFSTLCEVGEFWKRIFEIYIQDNKLNIVTVDTPDYYGEKLVV
jgi:hypothetical protein